MSKASKARRELQEAFAQLLEKSWLGLYVEEPGQHDEESRTFIHSTTLKRANYWIQLADRFRISSGW